MVAFAMDGKSIRTIDNTVIKVPIIGEKQYVCRVYCNGNTVPNIKFNMHDSNIQTGVFKFVKGTQQLKVNFSPKHVEWDVKKQPSHQVNLAFLLPC